MKRINARLATLENLQRAHLWRQNERWVFDVISRLKLTQAERATLAGYLRRLALDPQTLPTKAEQATWARVQADCELWRQWRTMVSQALAMPESPHGRQN